MKDISDDDIERAINNGIFDPEILKLYSSEISSTGVKVILNEALSQTSSIVLSKINGLGKYLNAVLMLDGPKTNIIQGSNGVVAADMQLDWLNYMESDKHDILMSDSILLNLGNLRWLKAVTGATPEIVNLMKNGNNKFIFVPGVNTTITDMLLGDAGMTINQIETLASSFDINNQRVMFFHSAGTEAGLRAIEEAKKQGVDLSQFKFVFASPRVRRETFINYLNRAGISSSQVLVVTAANDLPHWPTDVFPNIISSVETDYESNRINGQIRYNYLFLESDLSSSSPLLGHGGMIDGAISDHKYIVTKNGVRVQAKLRSINSDFSNGSF